MTMSSNAILTGPPARFPIYGLAGFEGDARVQEALA